MDSQSSDAANRPQFSEESRKVQGDVVMENALEEAQSVADSCRERLHQLINGDSLDFGAWNSLITEIEKIHPDDIDMISLAYDSLLSKFPLCHWYWQRYAYHKARLCNADKAVETFEQAVELTPFSVGLWYEYCHFAITYSDDPDDVRRLFQKGLAIVGKDYYCHVLWDKYMVFEFSQQKWDALAKVYAQALRFPTQKLQKYYKIFKDLVSILEEEIRSLNNGNLEVQAEELYNGASALSDKEISQVVNDLWDPCDISVRCKALHRYKFIGDQLYQKACQLDEKIKSFESNIQRRYFHITPIDDDQLNNWHRYLDFIEKQEDFDWALKLYERCLISCANYPEFWMRYVDFMEAQGGRELALFAIERAKTVFLNVRFSEQIRDLGGARASFSNYDSGCDIYFIESVVKQANMEKRLGNDEAACEIYEKALRWAMPDKEKQHFLPKLYIHYYRLKHMLTGGADTSRDVLIEGIKQVPDSRLLYEFVDLCGTVHDVKKAWNLHIKLFPQLIRVNPLYKYPTSKERQSNSPVLLNLPSKNQSSGDLIRQPEQDKLPSLPLVDDKQPSNVSAEQIPTLDDDDVANKKLQQLSPKVSVDFDDESKTDASKQMELVDGLDQRPKEDCPQQMDWTSISERQSKEDASRLLEQEQPSGPNVPPEISEEEARSTNILCPQELELEKQLESVSLEKISPDSQQEVPEGQVLVASDHHGSEEIPSTSNHRSADGHLNAGHDRSFVTLAQNEADENKSAADSAQSWDFTAASHQNPTETPHPSSRVTSSRAENQCETKDMDHQLHPQQESYPHQQPYLNQQTYQQQVAIFQQQQQLQSLPYQHQQFQQQIPYLQHMQQQYHQQQYQQMVQSMQPYNQSPALAYQYQMNQQGYEQVLQQYQLNQQTSHTLQQQQEQGGYPQVQQHQEQHQHLQEQLDQGQQIVQHGTTSLESQPERVSTQSTTAEEGSSHPKSAQGSF
nr:pre-mRNA-processing factor 39 isoform X2 [Ipomoea batatas]